jgi:hypothetical protein
MGLERTLHILCSCIDLSLWVDSGTVIKVEGGGADINNWQLIGGGSLLVWLIKQGGVMILLSIHYR